MKRPADPHWMLVEYFAGKPRAELLAFIFYLGWRAGSSQGGFSPTGKDRYVVSAIGQALSLPTKEAA